MSWFIQILTIQASPKGYYSWNVQQGKPSLQYMTFRQKLILTTTWAGPRIIYETNLCTCVWVVIQNQLMKLEQLTFSHEQHCFIGWQYGINENEKHLSLLPDCGPSQTHFCWHSDSTMTNYTFRLWPKRHLSFLKLFLLGILLQQEEN